MFEDMQEFNMCFNLSLLLGRYYSIRLVNWNVDLKIVDSEENRQDEQNLHQNDTTCFQWDLYILLQKNAWGKTQSIYSMPVVVTAEEGLR